MRIVDKLWKTIRIYCYARDAFERTRVRATHPHAHFRTRDTCTQSRHNRTYGNQ